MCGCEQDTPYVPPHPEPWKLVSVSLLQMFLAPVQCLLRNRVYDDYLTEQVLNELSVLISSYIDAKLSNPDTELYYDQLPAIQEKLDYIYKRKVCL